MPTKIAEYVERIRQAGGAGGTHSLTFLEDADMVLSKELTEYLVKFEQLVPSYIKKVQSKRERKKYKDAWAKRERRHGRDPNVAESTHAVSDGSDQALNGCLGADPSTVPPSSSRSSPVPERQVELFSDAQSLSFMLDQM